VVFYPGRIFCHGSLSGKRNIAELSAISAFAFIAKMKKNTINILSKDLTQNKCFINLFVSIS